MITAGVDDIFSPESSPWHTIKLLSHTGSVDGRCLPVRDPTNPRLSNRPRFSFEVASMKHKHASRNHDTTTVGRRRRKSQWHNAQHNKSNRKSNEDGRPEIKTFIDSSQEPIPSDGKMMEKHDSNAEKKSACQGAISCVTVSMGILCCYQ